MLNRNKLLRLRFFNKRFIIEGVFLKGFVIEEILMIIVYDV